MTAIEKIKQLYNITSVENQGFADSELQQVEKRLHIKLPLKLREYYLALGKNEAINYSHNRLLKPGGEEIGFSDDRYLVFYEENQVVAYWGIKEGDLGMDNPPVYGFYGDEWMKETDTTEDFFLLMAVYNGTLGGLKYVANAFTTLPPAVVKEIEVRWELLPEISWEKQKVYTADYREVISLSFDDQQQCTGIFAGTDIQDRFDNMLDTLDIDWSYTSYDEEEGEED